MWLLRSSIYEAHPIMRFLASHGIERHLFPHVCREVMHEEGRDGLPVVTGLRMTKAGKEELVTADAYVAALDVPGAKKLIPQVWCVHAHACLPDRPHLPAHLCAHYSQAF